MAMLSLARIAQLCAWPAVIAENRNPPATGIGVVEFTLRPSPLPNCDELSLPQQKATPCAFSPHAWSPPAAMRLSETAVRVTGPTTRLGVVEVPVDAVPLPSW